MELCISSKYQNIILVNITTIFLRKILSFVRLKFYHWQQILLVSSDRFTSIIFEKIPAKYSCLNNHSLLLILSSKMIFHERLAGSACDSIAQVLFLQITIILQYTEVYFVCFPFHHMEY